MGRARRLRWVMAGAVVSAVIVTTAHSCRGTSWLQPNALTARPSRKKKGETFVPEGIVWFGKRTEGRDGVVTIKAEDERIKYQGLHHGSSYLEHLNFLSAIRGRGASGPSVNLSDGLLSVAIGVAGQLSIEQGRFVTIEEVLGS